MSLLDVSDVSRNFGGILAIDHVSFGVEEGQIVGMIGPNGAGKTTMFNLITRLYQPHGGEIVFDGKSLLHTPPHGVIRRGIARTFQNIELFETMTVLENVLVGAEPRLRWFRESDNRRLAREVLDYVGLTPLADRPATGLPFGTLKRIEIARALAGRPKLLLLDEPAGGLSHEELEELAAFIRRLRVDYELTVLLVEHHMNLVMGVSDTVHVLDFGKLIASGPPSEVRANPAVIEAYLGKEEESAVGATGAD
jgi:branched-chain amino acid transport system ATP-binding protein